MSTVDRISTLQAELDALKRERKAQKIKAKIESIWLKVENATPEGETCRVLAWANGQVERCWFSKGQWYLYDGTFFLTEKDKLDGVTYWMGRDWMYTKEWPKHGPTLAHKLKYHWQRLTDRAGDMAHDLRPAGWGSKAQMSKKPTFYRDRTGKILSGMPENLPAPQGYEKIVCGSALEAERYSSLQRQQERYEHGKQQAERGAIEAEFQNEWRRDAHTLMANARNNKNRDFMRRALERNASKGDPTAYQRESFLHSEGFEDRR
jgi:hypothetical protein